MRTARVMGTIVEAKGRQKWEVEWDWHHPNVDKRKGESPSAHLRFEEAEIDVRRRTVRITTLEKGKQIVRDLEFESAKEAAHAVAKVRYNKNLILENRDRTSKRGSAGLAGSKG